MFPLFFIPIGGLTQNLILNGDFEQKNDCPTGIGQLSKATYWQSLNTGTPEYFNTQCDFFDFADTSSKGYTGLIIHSQYTEAIEYFGQRLKAPLDSGKYNLKFKIKARKGPFYCNNFGVVLRKGEIKMNYWGRWKEKPVFYIDTVIKSQNWFFVNTAIQAKGGEDFIAFGNFLSDDLVQLQVDRSEKVTDGWQSYYYLDDIELSKVGGIINKGTIEAPKSKKKLVIYFDSDSYYLAENYQDSINQFVKMAVTKPPFNCTLIGHTDSDGTEKYNFDLSFNRVLAVKNYLSQMFPDTFQFVLVPKGETEPFNTEQNESDKGLNRRVELQID